MSRQISLDKFFPNRNGNSHSVKRKVEDRNDYYKDYDNVKRTSVVIVETENEPLLVCMKVMNLIVKMSLMNLLKLNLNNPRQCITSINVY